MSRPIRILAGLLRWSALVPLTLGIVLQFGGSDLLSLVAGGPFGGARRAAVVMHLAAAALAGIALALTPYSRRNRRRLTLFAVAMVAVPLAVIQLARSSGFSTRTVTYTSADGTPIEATLYVPTRADSYPGIDVVHGSAAILRGVYDFWAAPLARAGFTVLLADKRGVGGTGGVFDREDNTGEANIGRLRNDVVAGVRFLATQPEADSTRIGLFGVSQAGWVAPAAAAEDRRVRYMVLITAPTVSTREEGRWSRLRGDDHADASVGRAAAEAVLDTVQASGVDARTFLGTLRIPGLWLFGEEDNSVPTRKSIRVLDSLATAGHPYEWRLYQGYGHALIGRGDGQLTPQSAPIAMRDIIVWLEGATR